MASKEEGSEPLQVKKWTLKVSIHCEGCKKKVKKILQNVAGVYEIEIDSRQNKVTVTGNVEAETLLRKLLKSGKHAELWPVEKKPNNPNPNPNPNGKGKNKEKEKDAGKEKDAAKSNEPNENKTEKPPEKSTAATKPETATKPAAEAAASQPEKVTPTTKPAETDTKPVPSTEVSGSTSSNKESPKPDPKPEKPPKSSEPETKPADTATKSGSSSKKKEKKEAEAGGGNEEVVMNSGGAPPMYHQVPAYPQPVYAASYNMSHPTASYSYYAPMPPMPQSYLYSGHPPPPPPEYYPHYQHYPPDNYYGPMEPPASSSQPQGSYDYFSDENANSCNVM